MVLVDTGTAVAVSVTHTTSSPFSSASCPPTPSASPPFLYGTIPLVLVALATSCIRCVGVPITVDSRKIIPLPTF